MFLCSVHYFSVYYKFYNVGVGPLWDGEEEGERKGELGTLVAMLQVEKQTLKKSVISQRCWALFLSLEKIHLVKTLVAN